MLFNLIILSSKYISYTWHDDKYAMIKTMRKYDEILWDVAVIGGGPAGMMAAARAAERGAQVIVLEKNDTLGKKLLITGGGRCNVTNAEPDTRTFLLKFKKNDKFLFSAFAQWSVKETLDFFHARGMPTKIEAEHRVFPQSNSARSVWDVLVRSMKNSGVSILSDSPVTGFIKKGNALEAVRLINNKELRAKTFVLATGGTSRPETGSTGDGFLWLEKLGHTVTHPDPALVPIAIKDLWVKKLQGVNLSDVNITCTQNGQKQGARKGKIVFTHFGVSGPAVLNISKDVGELLKYGTVSLSLDLFPKDDQARLDQKLQEVFKKGSNKKFKNSLGGLIPASIAAAVVGLSHINPDIMCNSISRMQRLALGKLLKDIPMRVEKLLSLKKAVVSSGGVALEEVDFKTMRSRLYQNLYLVGDILNIDRPSGGYSLQLCWTTGFVAGNSAAESVRS